MDVKHGGADGAPVAVVLRLGGELDRGAGEYRREAPLDPADDDRGEREEPVSAGLKLVREEDRGDQAGGEDQRFGDEDADGAGQRAAADVRTGRRWRWRCRLRL